MSSEERLVIPELSDEIIANGLDKMASWYEFGSATNVTLRTAAQRLRKYSDEALRNQGG